MIDFSHASKYSKALKALSDLNRIKILELLFRNEMCVTELVKTLNLDQPKVSHHLAILKRAGVILDRRQGRKIIYSLHPGVHREPSDLVDRIDFGYCSVEFKRRADYRKEREMVGEGEAASG